MTPSRREFLQTLAATGPLWRSRRGRPARPTRASTSCSTSRSAPLRPSCYGHFAEHLGGVVYDGIWVGENSAVPNDYGIRRRSPSELKHIKAPVDPVAGRLLRRQLRLARRHRRARQAPRAHRTSGPTHVRKAAAPAGSQRFDPESLRHGRVRALLPAHRRRSRASPPTCAACRRATSTSGSSTAHSPAGGRPAWRRSARGAKASAIR